MSNTLETLHDLVCQTHAGHVLHEDIEQLHKHITSQPGGKELIEAASKAITSIPASPSDKRATTLAAASSSGGGAFKARLAASGGFVGFLVYQSVWVQVNVNGKQRDFRADLFGLTVGLPGGGLTGHLYFDDINDISGTWEVQCSCVAAYYYVVFLRNGKTVMTFQAGNLGSSFGIVYGKGSWS